MNDLDPVPDDPGDDLPDPRTAHRAAMRSTGQSVTTSNPDDPDDPIRAHRQAMRSTGNHF